MKNSTAISSYISGDVYSIWKLKIKKAESELLIVSPYFNKVLIDLIQSSPLNKENIKILTRISSDTAWEDKNQLLTALKLVKMGVQLRELPNLHAKLLIVDKADLTLGSQNFTSNGRKAKEASVCSESRLDNSNFIDSIYIWWEEATSIPSNLLSDLLENKKNLFRSIKDLKQNADKIFDDFHNDCNREKDRVETEKREMEKREAIERQKILIINNQKLEKIAYANVNSRLFESKSAPRIQKIVKVKPGYNLEKILNVDGLNHCYFYPMFMPQDKKMVYVRVAGTRISYVSYCVFRKTNNALIEVEGVKYYPKVYLSGDEFNIKVQLKKHESDENSDEIFWFKFDGQCIIPQDIYPDVDRKQLEEVIFAPFKYQNLIKYQNNNMYRRKIENFFPSQVELKFTVRETLHRLNVLECRY